MRLPKAHQDAARVLRTGRVRFPRKDRSTPTRKSSEKPEAPAAKNVGGRPPNPKTTEEAIAQTEAYLDAQLPKFVRKLGELALGSPGDPERGIPARAPDRQALQYLIDRKLGKVGEMDKADNQEKFLRGLERVAKAVARMRGEESDSPALPEPTVVITEVVDGEAS